MFPFVAKTVGVGFGAFSTLLLAKHWFPFAQAGRNVCRLCFLQALCRAQSSGCSSAFVKGRLQWRPTCCTLPHVQCVGYSCELRELKDVKGFLQSSASSSVGFFTYFYIGVRR